ncbi:hypothetical protein LSAT2_003047 [Lamellibrachia satsuma]|nr:hypothetical protein LSAT2_003047 [Lamellibrachia satsuma]
MHANGGFLVFLAVVSAVTFTAQTERTHDPSAMTLNVGSQDVSADQVLVKRAAVKAVSCGKCTCSCSGPCKCVRTSHGCKCTSQKNTVYSSCYVRTKNHNCASYARGSRCYCFNNKRTNCNSP